MMKLSEFLQILDGAPDGPPRLDAGDVVTANMLGIEFAAVLLPAEVLNEDRLSRMNRFWDTIGERDVLVIALTPKPLLAR